MLSQGTPKRIKLGTLVVGAELGGLLSWQEDWSCQLSSLLPLRRDCVKVNFSQRKAEMRKGERDSLMITSQYLDLAGPEAELPLR